MQLISLLALLASTAVLSHAADTARYLSKPAEWFKSAEAREIGNNILSWQTKEGSWPKNTDTVSAPRPTNAQASSGTFDNGATTGELRFLAKLYNATREERFSNAFFKGLNLILKAQYPNGGWPQSYPAAGGYARHITFNDDTFVRLAEFTRDVGASPEFDFVSAELRQQATRAFERAIDCILRTQIELDGKLTVWCAQHDEVTLEPRPARTYELVSLSGAESAKILRFLMSLENPSPEIRAAIEAGAQWFEQVKITGLRQLRENGERKLARDETAPPLWARFYEIGTNRPIFSGRDGIKRYSIDEIEAERRNGYAWYGDWGAAVAENYRLWRTKFASDR